MELYQLFSFAILSLFANLVTLTCGIEFSTQVKVDIGHPNQSKFRKMTKRPGMVPEKQLKKPVELMSQDEYKVTRLNEEDTMLRFGKRKQEPTPSKLTVTDEIFFELEIENYSSPGEHLRQNITIACFGGLTPITCLNFVSIAKGFRKGKNRLSYKGGKVSKVVQDFMVQMGDTTEGGNDSIFGRNFADESFAISHNHAGWVGMANFGTNSNGSQFYVLLKTARWLDGKHVIFGKVIKGMEFIQMIGNQDADVHNKPINTISIVNCGSLKLRKPYRLNEAQFNTDDDIERTDGDEI